MDTFHFISYNQQKEYFHSFSDTKMLKHIMLLNSNLMELIWLGLSEEHSWK